MSSMQSTHGWNQDEGALCEFKSLSDRRYGLVCFQGAGEFSGGGRKSICEILREAVSITHAARVPGENAQNLACSARPSARRPQGLDDFSKVLLLGDSQRGIFKKFLKD